LPDHDELTTEAADVVERIADTLDLFPSIPAKSDEVADLGTFIQRQKSLSSSRNWKLDL